MEIIGEIANAHQGNYRKALELGKAAFDSDADSVKFQIYFAYEFLSADHPRFDHFKKQSFSKKKWQWIISKLRKYNNTKKIYADVFGIDALNFAINLKLDGVKIHSSDLSNLEILNVLKNYKNKIFISCGGSTLLEIYNTVSYLKKKKIILLHGFQSYPTSIEDINFEKLFRLKIFFGNMCSYGYQDHTSGGSVYNIYMSILSMGFDINYIEKHITFNRKKKGVDYFSSLEPNKFKLFVKIIKKILPSIKKNAPWFSKKEIIYRNQVKKNWLAIKNINSHDTLNYKNVKMLRNNDDKIFPINLKKYIKKKIIKNIDKGTIISKKLFKNKICVVIVARSKSKRLKNKALKKIGDSCVLDHLFKRAKKLENVNDIIFCTTKEKEDLKLCRIASKNNIKYYRGSTLNVLDRMMRPLLKIKPDIVVRITGDDILIDNKYFQLALDYFLSHNLDYVDHKKLIGGTETEIFDFDTLKFIYKNFKDLSGTEYLTNYIHNNLGFFNIKSAPIKKEHVLKKKVSMTIDTNDDYKYVKNFLNIYFRKSKNYYNYNYSDIISYCKKVKKKTNKNQIKIKINTSINNENLIK